MKTYHKFIIDDARQMKNITEDTVDLIVTSPPYPMIEMWDNLFTAFNPLVGEALAKGEGLGAFELMHQELDKVWEKSFDVLKEGGIACINIGDATRSLAENFQLYSNHARIITSCQEIGFTILPSILWRKPTNSPTKFMGSGMLPPSAYVTLEHEHILIMRKGGRRKFKDNEKVNRAASSYFWEERNCWFSDIWEGLIGTRQKMDPKNNEENFELRKRSAAYPFELAYRLINMFSLQEDLILDPFAGTGTSTLAAMASQRNSLSLEIEKTLNSIFLEGLNDFVFFANAYLDKRLAEHQKFVEERLENKKSLKYRNEVLAVPVTTKQEKNMTLAYLKEVKEEAGGGFLVEYRN